jgi:TPR repeat protein/serine/threonine protein kinase
LETEELQSGTVIRDCYRIERTLGKGGMGTVYLAEHILMGEPRALKFLSPSLAANPAFVQRFLQEARAASKLRHPNIAATLELGQAEGGGLYISMEYIEGPSLRAVLQALPHGLDPRRAFTLVHSIAEGLGAAHTRGLVHRDIKPENILLATVQTAGRAVEVPKIVDFGIVAMNDAQGMLTQTGLPLLTAEYAAPEQWRGTIPSAQLDGRTDLYALGCLFYETLTGRMPFHADTYEGWFSCHLTAVPPAPSALRPELSAFAGLDTLVLRLLAKEREQRPSSAAEVAEAIDAVIARGAQTQKLETPHLGYLTERPQGTPPTATLSRTQLDFRTARPPEPAAWTPVPQANQPSAPPMPAQPSAPAGYPQNFAAGSPPQPASFAPQQGFAPQTGFAPPPPFPPAQPFLSAGPPLRPPPPARRKSTIHLGVLFGILGAFLLITTAVVGAFIYMRRQQEPQPGQTDTQTSSATTADTPAGSPGGATSPANSVPAPTPPATQPALPGTPRDTGGRAGARGPAPNANALPTDPVSLAAKAIALYNEKDYKDAAALLTQACSGGQADSCDYLGYAYLHKLGVGQDYGQASSAYQKGCEAGSMAACSHLAAMFQNSVGVGQDPARARSLYQKACEGGLSEACQNLGRMLQSKVEGGQDLPRAATVYAKACDNGNMASCNSLGSMYQHGQGVPADPAKALPLYQKACDGNFLDGCNNLGFLYQAGLSVERDYARAANLYTKACSGGNSFACNNLGIMYQDNEGVARDYAHAASLYTQACSGGSSNGCSDLGELYRKGLGVPKDAEKARTYLSKGCDMGNQFGCEHMKLIQ